MWMNIRCVIHGQAKSAEDPVGRGYQCKNQHWRRDCTGQLLGATIKPSTFKPPGERTVISCVLRFRLCGFWPCRSMLSWRQSVCSLPRRRHESFPLWFPALSCILVPSALVKKISNVISGYSAQPWPEPPKVLKLIKILPGIYEGLMRQLLALLNICGPTEGDCANKFLILCDNRSKSLPVAS